MQIFILGRTLAEQRLFAEMIQEQMGASPKTLPIFSGVPAGSSTASPPRWAMAADLAGIPLSAYLEDCAEPLCADPGAAYRQWREWFQAEHLLVIAADAPETFISLLEHDEKSAVVYLEEPGPITCASAQAAVSAYLAWRNTVGRPVPTYRVSPDEFDALTADDQVPGMYEGPSQAFFDLWAA